MVNFTPLDQRKTGGINFEAIEGVQYPQQSFDDDAEKGESFLGSLAKPFVKAAVRTGQAVGALGARALGVDSVRVADAIQQDTTVKTGIFGDITIEGQKPGKEGTKQIGADVLENAALLVPYGRFAKVLSQGPKAIGVSQGKSTVLGASGAGASGGLAFDTASGLRSGEEDPLSPGIATAIGAAGPLAPFILKGIGRTTKYAYTQMTGLNRETVETLLTNPKALTAAQQSGIDRRTLATQVTDAFEKRLDDLSETGKGYQAIRESSAKIKLKEDIPTTILSKFGVKVENGAIKVGPESTPLTSADRRAIEDFITQYAGATELSANGLLNVRKALDNLARKTLGSEKSGVSGAISTAMRKEYDKLAKKTLPGLKELDDKYGPERKLLNTLKKDLFDKEGNLKDTAMTRIANIANTGKEQQLARLEKLVPGIGQRAQLLKAVEDIGATGGQKVGTYARSIVVGAPAFAANPLAGVLTAMISMPAVAVPVLKTIGMARGWTKDSITKLIAKLTTGKTLTAPELVMFRAAMKDHLAHLSPGDQFLDSKLGQKATKYNKEAQAGLSIKPVQMSRKELVQKLRTSIDDETKQEMANFVEVVKSKQVTTSKEGALQFASKEAETAFEDGLRLLEKPLLRDAASNNATIGEIATLFDEVLDVGGVVPK